MSEALIGGICTIVTAIITILITDFLSKKREKENADLIKQLKSDNATLKISLQELTKAYPKNFEIIRDVEDVLHKNILPIISQQSLKQKKITIRNFGLDLHSVMPWMKNRIVDSDEFDHILIEIKSLIINPESQYLKEFIDGSSNIYSSVIRANISIGRDLKDDEELDRFALEIRQYDLPPIFHGFILNDEHLFLGFTEIHKGKIIGGTRPYLHLWKMEDNDSDFNKHAFRFFQDWFNYYWSISKEVVNVKK